MNQAYPEKNSYFCFQMFKNMKFRVAVLFVLFSSIWSFSQNEVNVLFIGNSFTFMNNMPFLFRDIAISKNHAVFVDTVVEGGKDFDYHAHSKETYAAIKSRKWDYVIIQGHSNELAQPESIVDKESLPFAKQIVDSIRANSACTQVVLYMTWGYKNGNPKWSAVATYDSMQGRIKNQYLRFADLLDARISPVGEVWKTIRTNFPGINLYHPDNIHPSLEGSYLIANTFFAAIFGESPMRNDAKIQLDPTVRAIIETNVSQVVLNNLNQWRFVPRSNPIQTGFDILINNRNIAVFDRSINGNSIEWNFGDGEISTQKNPDHSYKQAGSYSLVQKITNYCQTVELVRKITIQ
jgi:hypothetical protein